MTGPVPLPGVRASSPMGLLVALGTLDVLTEHYDAGTRLAWCDDGSGHCAAITAGGATTPDELADRTFDAIAADSLAAIQSLAKDLNQVTPGALHDALGNPGFPRSVAGLCAEAPLRPAGQVAMTPLVITSFQGRRSVFGTLLRSDADLTERQLSALFSGPWRYARSVATLNLDPGAREQDSARMAADASADGTRGVPGSLSLAARGLTLLPPLPTGSGRGKRPRVAAVHEGRFAWPVWTSALTRFGVRALMGRSWGAVLDGATLDAYGIAAVFESEIVDAKDGRRLAHARRRA